LLGDSLSLEKELEGLNTLDYEYTHERYASIRINRRIR
jgi:hypothetical protein